MEIMALEFLEKSKDLRKNPCPSETELQNKVYGALAEDLQTAQWDRMFTLLSLQRITTAERIMGMSNQQIRDMARTCHLMHTAHCILPYNEND